MIRKLQSRSGETITEVLVASLVIVLGVLLFAMMVQSSFRIVSTSEEKVLAIYESESNAESGEGTPVGTAAPALDYTGKGFLRDDDFKNLGNVTIYGNKDVKSYKLNGKNDD